MKVRHKGLVVILDGLGDRRIPALGEMTPLEAARTPQLDRLAAGGVCGLVDPLIPGMPVATHTGTGVLLGLTPRDAYLFCRGPVEAAGVGLIMQPGDVAIRCNFATLEAELEGDIDLNGFLGLDPNVPKGYTAIRVNYRIKANPDDIDEIRSLASFSPVFNTLTQGTDVEFSVEEM